VEDAAGKWLWVGPRQYDSDDEDGSTEDLTQALHRLSLGGVEFGSIDVPARWAVFVGAGQGW
jgi:hypothetical protein